MSDEIEEKIKKSSVLTKKEIEVLCIAGLGYSNNFIADKLEIKTRTVESHRRNAMNKLKLKNKDEVIEYVKINSNQLNKAIEESTARFFIREDMIRVALLTWYSKDHPLHFNLRHPAIKLAGEAGEILDLWAKNEYKPGFNWWACRHCGRDGDLHYPHCKNNIFIQYTPLILDELGDYWYYLRILSYISKRKIADKHSECPESELDKLFVSMNVVSAKIAQDIITHNQYQFGLGELNLCYSYLLGILKILNTSLDELTELNYIKLNSEPTAHGWKGA